MSQPIRAVYKGGWLWLLDPVHLTEGQEIRVEASTVAEVVRMAYAGIRNPGTPVGVLLFVGPSGVGKTETALALADLLYGVVETTSEFPTNWPVEKPLNVCGAQAGGCGRPSIQMIRCPSVVCAQTWIASRRCVCGSRSSQMRKLPRARI